MLDCEEDRRGENRRKGRGEEEKKKKKTENGINEIWFSGI